MIWFFIFPQWFVCNQDTDSLFYSTVYRYYFYYGQQGVTVV